MTDFNVLAILESEGYIKDGEDNLVHAEKAFFAARVLRWIRQNAQSDPSFDLPSYLTILMYYKMGMAELRFSDENKLLYKMNNPEPEVQEIVDSLIKNIGKPFPADPPEENKGETPGDSDGDSDS